MLAQQDQTLDRAGIRGGLGGEPGSPNAAGGVADEFRQLVTCRIGGEEFAIDILSVQEIIRLGDITKVPKAPPFVEGVINVRGRIIPVLELRRRIGLPPGARTARSRIVIVNACGLTVGLLVDSVSEVMRVPRAAIGPPPTGSASTDDFVQGVARLNERLLVLADLGRLLKPNA
jgi:purine-binding chemotaxis protein CheW